MSIEISIYYWFLKPTNYTLMNVGNAIKRCFGM